MGHRTILIVEGEASLRTLTSRYLTREGYCVYESTTSKDAINIFMQHPIDLILMNIELPDGDGPSLCAYIKKRLKIPVIFMSSSNMDRDDWIEIALSADDFITAPFDPIILIARIETILNRAHNLKSKSSDLLSIGPFQLNFKGKEVYCNHEQKNLTRREYQLFEHLATNTNIVFTRDQLLECVWGQDFMGQTRTVDTHIKKLREKLDPSSQYIQTVWGTGYKFRI